MSKNESTAETAGTLRELRTKAEDMSRAAIANKDELGEALPVLIRLQERIATLQKALTISRSVASRLSERCTAYAVKTQGVLVDGTLYEDQNGVRVGDFKVGNETYHLAMGYSGYERVDGNNMSQAFLKGLPEAWVRTKLELDVTSINMIAPTVEKLTVTGLKEKAHNVWTLKPDASDE